jgi:uncharacterized protein YaaQ
MKMLIAILKENDTDLATQALTSAGFRVTRIASTGGFIKRGTATFLIGVEDEKVEEAINILREKIAHLPGEKRATVFVVPVERFEHL